jgi:hypothetical protein
MGTSFGAYRAYKVKGALKGKRDLPIPKNKILVFLFTTFLFNVMVI